MTALQDGNSAIQKASLGEIKRFGFAAGLRLSSTLGLAHGISDCAVGFLIGSLALSGSPAQAGWLALAYNGLAFGLQPAAGWLADRSRRYREMVLVGLSLSGAALLLFVVQPDLAIVLAGLGSAALHAAGGGLAIQATPGRAAGPGWFAAPGVVGLALGGLLATRGGSPIWLLVLALAGAGTLVAILCPTSKTSPFRSTGQASHEWIILALILALTLRSTVWTGLHLQAESQSELFLQLALAAALGKALGGMLADWLTWRRWILAALALAAVLLAVSGFRNPAGLVLLAGVFFLQSITPALLAALGGALPGRPGLAAGLGLGLAVILGSLPALAGWSTELSVLLPLLLILTAIGGLAWFAIRP